MRIVLVRHAEAESPHLQVDSERALTARGHTQAGETGVWLASFIDEPLVLACSSFRRARETATRIQQALPQASLRIVDHLTPGDDVRQAAAAIETVSVGGTLIVVSHMPLIAGLANWLSEGVSGGGQPFGLAEARVYELELPGPAQARLVKRFSPVA